MKRAIDGEASSVGGLPRLAPEFDTWLGPVRRGRLTADDGQLLAYQSFGDGSAVLFANGIGVTYPGAALQIADLRQDHRVICWDYRGMGESIGDDPPRDVSIGRHAADAVAVLDHLEVDEAVGIGFSMGVQVLLEVIRDHPERIRGFVAMMGASGTTIRQAFGRDLGPLAEESVRVGVHVPEISQFCMDLAVSFPDSAFTLFSSLSLVQPGANRLVLDFHIRSVASQDRKLYNRTMLELARHDAADVLGTIAVPSLVVAAQHDLLTPPRVARQMAEAIEGAIYRQVRGGSHFAMCEYPNRINDWVRELVERVS